MYHVTQYLQHGLEQYLESKYVNYFWSKMCE